MSVAIGDVNLVLIVVCKFVPSSNLFPSKGILPIIITPFVSCPTLFTSFPFTVAFLLVLSLSISTFFSSSSSAVSLLPSIDTVFVVTKPVGATTFIFPSSATDDGAKLSSEIFATILINAPFVVADELYFVSRPVKLTVNWFPCISKLPAVISSS